MRSVKVRWAFAAVLGMLAAGRAEADSVTLTLEPASSTNLGNVVAGDTVVFDVFAQGTTVGEHLKAIDIGSEFGPLDTASLSVNSLAFAPTAANDLTTDPQVFTFNLVAESAGVASFDVFAEPPDYVTTNLAQYEPTSNTVTFTVLPAISTPLPKPAIAGAGLLGLLGVSQMRRRRTVA